MEEPGDEKKSRPPRSFRYVELWDEPGLGAEPNLEEASKYVLDKFEFKRAYRRAAPASAKKNETRLM